MMLDIEKKEKVIKKLSNEVNEYKHKLKQRKVASHIRRPQTALPPTTKHLHRTTKIPKNTRKRKQPSSNDNTNSNSNQSKTENHHNRNTNAPATKRRKIQ